MNVDDDQKNFMRICHLIFLLILTMHIITCFWNFVIHMGNIWVIPLDFVSAGQYPGIYTYFERDDIQQFYVQFYNSLLFLGGNEMGPRTDLEMMLCPMILIFISCFNAWLFGDMAMLADTNSQKSIKLQNEIDTANLALHNWEVTEDMRTDVR
jgi:hypothetical protein